MVTNAHDMKKKIYIITLILWSISSLYTLTSCSNKKEQATAVDQSLFFDASQVDTLLSETIQRIDFLALEATDNSDVFGVSKMVIKNDLIFMGDYHSGRIVVYDMNGKVKYVLNAKGAGPQEYLELKSFAVDERNIYTLDNSRHTVNSYDCLTGKFKQSQKLPFIAWDMEVLDNEHFIFAFIPLEGGRPNLSQPPYKILITDRDFEITDKHLKYEQDEYEFMGNANGTYFTQTKDGIVFSSMASDSFMIFYDGDSLKQKTIDFAEKIPDEFRKDRKKILENEYNFMLQTPILCKNYMAFEISVGDNIFSYIYDENAGCFHGNAEVSSHNYLFEPITSYKNQLVSYLDNYSLYEEVVETGFAKASPEIERHLKNEGAILILYTMR